MVPRRLFQSVAEMWSIGLQRRPCCHGCRTGICTSEVWGKGAVVVVDISCPSWCVAHVARDADEAEGCRTHRGPELIVELAEVVFVGVARTVVVRLCARDSAGSRQYFIELVDPNSAIVTLTIVEARAVANMLIRGADLVLEPVDGPCPSWCQDHRPPASDDPEDGLEHRGPYLAIVAAGRDGRGVAFGVRVAAFDDDGSRRVALYMLVQSIATELQGDEACKIVAHLLELTEWAEGT